MTIPDLTVKSCGIKKELPPKKINVLFSLKLLSFYKGFLNKVLHFKGFVQIIHQNKGVFFKILNNKFIKNGHFELG